jgi:hypothetical protein
MGAFVALVTFNRAITAPARGINTSGLTELLVLRSVRSAPKPASGRSNGGPIRIIRRCGRRYWYGHHGWTRSPVNSARRLRSGDCASSCGHAVRLVELLQHVWRVARPRVRF